MNSVIASGDYSLIRSCRNSVTASVIDSYLLSKTTWLISGLVVNAGRMQRNLLNTKGLIFSGQLLLDLAAAGMLREDAYRLVQGHALKSWQDDGDFRAAVEADPKITRHLTWEQVAHAFDVRRQLTNIDAIFQRVFGITASITGDPAQVSCETAVTLRSCKKIVTRPPENIRRRLLGIERKAQRPL